MSQEQLYESIIQKRSYLCIGLDTDISKIPRSLLTAKNPVLEFNKQIIDATHQYAVAYKINTAFYEADGAKGWDTLQQTFDCIPSDIFTIADAKRGDIGNTSDRYAEAFFEKLNVDAITLSPYMGADSIQPFFKYQNKWVILLALTSNKGSEDIQMQKAGDKYVFEQVLDKAKHWGNAGNTMFVVGATHADMFTAVRAIVPDNFLLIPGVGAQGGNLEEITKAAINSKVGMLVNASRSIIYASDGNDFAQKSANAAKELQQEMEHFLKAYNFIQ